MSDVPQGPSWWQASDGKWYPPEQFTGAPAPEQPSSPPTWTPDAVYQAPDPAGQAPYGQQPGQVGYGYGATPPANEPLAIISLVCGIISIPLLCFCGFGLVPGIAAVVTGILGRKKIAESANSLTGDGMALAGLILGAIGIGLGALYLIANLALGVGSISTS